MKLIAKSSPNWTLARILFLVAILVPNLIFAQTGDVLETGDQVLDPNGDGFISLTNAGFDGDGYDVDEFEIKMFGIPIFGDGEALKDVQAGQPCGVSDLALDTAGYALYAGFDSNENLIFRFRVAGDKASVQSYSILIDTDQLMGNEDPNSSSINPGFEAEVTLIHNFGVYIYDIDGIESCPTPLVVYDVDTHQQKATSSEESCNDQDVFIDFYVPFSDLENFFGINTTTDIRFAGVTNISATCALAGKISDIGGVDDTAYDGCFACAILDLASTQCPSSVSNLCEACEGFPLGATETPAINLPVLVGDLNISGTAEPEAEIYIDLFSGLGVLLDQDTVNADLAGDWLSGNFTNPMTFEDSVVVNAKLPARCESGFNNSGLSFAIVSPNQPPIITGTNLALPYEENSAPIIIVEDLLITDDNTEIVSASVTISANYQLGPDKLNATTLAGIAMSFSEANGVLSFTGTANINDYIAVLQSVTFENTSDAPDFNIRTVSFKASDIINTSPAFDIDILVQPVNDPPEIIIGGSSTTDTLFVSTPEDTPFEICVTANDIEQDNLTITSLVVQDGQGIAVVSSDLCFLFDPNENYIGNEYVTVEICDNGTPALCDSAVVAINITPINDPPVITVNGNEVDSLFYRITQTEDLNFCLTGSDIDGDNIHFDSFTNLNATSSTLSWTNDLCFSYNKETNFLGTDEFTVIICDDGNPSKCVSIYISVEVTDGNQAPIITDPADTLFVSLLKNNSIEVCIPATDPNNDNISIANIEELLGVGGTVSSSFPCLTYTPPLNFVGTDLLKVFICDDLVNPLCDSVVVKFDVQPFNNPPEVIDNNVPVDTVFVSTKENTPLSFCLDLFDADSDNVVISSADIDASTPFGSIILDGDQCLIYEPATDNVGEVEIDIIICDDGSPSQCTAIVIIIDVLPENEPPSITNSSGVPIDTLFLQTQKNEQLDFCIDALDPDGDPITIEDIETILDGGIYVPQASSLCVAFNPTTDYVGDDIHLITVCDNGIPAKCDSVFVKIEVAPNNVPPAFLNNGLPVDTILFSTNENTPIEFCIDYSDPDGDNIVLDEFGVISGEGSFTRDVGALCFNYSPTINYFGNTWLTVSICDDAAASLCADLVIGIDVKNINQGPDILFNGILSDSLLFRVPERTTLSECIDITDKDGDVVIITSLVSTSGASTSTIATTADLCFDYTPGNDFLGTEWYTLTVCDNGTPSLCNIALVGIEVYHINVAPEAMPDEYTMYSNDDLVGNVLENDTDLENDSLFVDIALTVGPEIGMLDLSTDGAFIYTPPVDYLGSATFNYTACDVATGSLCSSTDVLITVEPRSLSPFQALSPNGDGFNDYWEVQGIEHYPDNHVKIFDRWNNLIFEIDGYNNRDIVWTGEVNRGLAKKNVDDGTYYYLISPGNGEDTLSGMVVLKR